MLRSTLNDLVAFLRNPRPMQADGLNTDGAIARWLVLAALQIAVLGVLVMPLILLWQKAFNLPSPNAFDGMSPLALWGGAVLLAPVLEELFFRGWMSGRPAALWLMGVLIAGLVLFAALGRGNALAAVAIVLLTLIAAGVAWWRTRGDRTVPGWFERAFPWLFYGGTIIFALMHVFNYPQVTLVVLPMVLPQFWTGLMLAHMRVRLGLFAAILNHIVSNAIMLTMALATS
ncbi:CPBP family intramembrane metalloprotease [Novosphingobium sp. ERN07]|uniref:CPBP family glutamic-type intramembrane protease n=1 Tax=Novosphingobium sp. ERN07 TaxID=2726187 RepID=UPI001456E3E8|nr:CPBP family glutamic-type intramembrane protease [Novosphingobium sp. ERN07]NLR69849.1 CPBP family intramembrane metalloprotease [Novosphingobium sp. ERN07]